MNTVEFLATHPVFSLDEAERLLAPIGGRTGLVNRLKHYLKVGRLETVTKGVYAVVPQGTSGQTFRPDPFLVAVITREDAVFSHHSALELLGAAHSTWNQLTLYTARRRRPILMQDATVRFLDVPGPLRAGPWGSLGTRQAERQGRLLRTTGPERTLVEGFHRPDLVGGLEELVLSAGGFPTLDLDLLGEVLERYRVRKLWAATGWFLERFRNAFQVPDAVLGRFEQQRPRSPHYLERNSRGGTFSSRWNLVVPESLGKVGGPDEP